MRVLTGIALVLAVLVAGGSATAGAAASLPTRDPIWWSPDASLRLTPSPPSSGPPDARFNDALTGWTLDGPGKIDVRAGGPAGHYAAIRDNTTLVSASWAVPSTAQIVTVYARSLHQRASLRVGALIAGRLTVLGTVTPGVSWHRYAFPAAPIHGKPVSLVLDPVMPFGEGIDIAAPGNTETPARGFVFDIGAATRVDAGPDGDAIAAEPGGFLLRGAPFRVPRDAMTISLWLHAQAGTAPQVSVEANGEDLGEATAGAGWVPLRLDATALRGRSVRLRVRSANAAGLQLALIGTVQRAAGLTIAKASRDPKHRRLLHVVVQGPTGLAGKRVRVDVERAGVFHAATFVTLDGYGRARLVLNVRLARTELRATFAGNEAFSPGVSAVHVVRAYHRPHKVPQSPKA